MKVRYITKSGEEILFDNSKYPHSFEKWFSDRIQHECAMFPYDNGRISIDALIKIEKVSDGE